MLWYTIQQDAMHHSIIENTFYSNTVLHDTQSLRIFDNFKYRTISPSLLRMSVRSREDVQVEPEKKKRKNYQKQFFLNTTPPPRTAQFRKIRKNKQLHTEK